jgi:uronate dehydrogenase
MILPTDRIVLTGAAGAIGTVLRAGLAPTFPNLVCTDLKKPAGAEGTWIEADIADRAALAHIMQGADALIHLAGAASSDLDTLWHANALGLFEAFEAARHAGVKRIVYASSNHAHGMYPIEVPVAPSMPARPDGHYGALKAYGELILQSFHDRYAITSVSLRIGTWRHLPIDQRSLATWLSPDDMVQLAERGLLHPNPGALVVNAYSNNTRLKVSRENWDFLGYAPKDDAETHRDMLRAQGIDVDSIDIGGIGQGTWEHPHHGGAFATSPELPTRLP